MVYHINIDRLQKDILELAEIGKTSDGGISRPSFSSADFQARSWLIEKMEQSGLCVRQDGAGNLFGRLEGSGKTVMSGSHLDSVLNGGRFDGPVGVLSALECLRTIQEDGIPVVKPLEVAAFTDEEGNLTGDFLGSRAFIGALNPELVKTGRTAFGVPFTEVLEKTEWTPQSILEAHQCRPDIEAFVELHIEQGPVLETEDKTIGIVERIAGKDVWMGAFSGRAGHAGTTPLELRHDAFLGLADFALKATHYVATQHYGSLITIGKVITHPGAFSIIPERVEFTLDFRSTNKNSLQEIRKELEKIASDISSTRGLLFSRAILDRTHPVDTSPALVKLTESICEQLSIPCMRMVSGAGHDSQILASVAPSLLIFIPCEDGISHSPKENIRWEDLKSGTEVLLETLIRLAG